MFPNIAIIENPKRHGLSYDKWLGDKKPLSHREKLCRAIDAVLLERPADFGVFLLKMEAAGYEIKRDVSCPAPFQASAGRAAVPKGYVLKGLGNRPNKQFLRNDPPGRMKS